MSLYGALFSGVSGLAAQSSAMGAISDNITNVNTIGYKGSKVNFSTLITKQVSTTNYSPGGVQSRPRTSVDVQGLLQATNNSTDVALSGQGFFVVNEAAHPSEGDMFAYTRAGSFKVDNEGYLQNVSGWYMQGWPLTGWDGNTQASTVDVGNNVYMKSYKNDVGDTVYINDNIVSERHLQPLNLNEMGGTASPTSNLRMGANLPNKKDVGFSVNQPVTIYDSLGGDSTLQFSWTKLAQNNWGVEAVPPTGARSVTLKNADGDVYQTMGRLDFNDLPEDGGAINMTINGSVYQFHATAGVDGTPSNAFYTDPAAASSIGDFVADFSADIDRAFRLEYESVHATPTLSGVDTVYPTGSYIQILGVNMDVSGMSATGAANEINTVMAANGYAITATGDDTAPGSLDIANNSGATIVISTGGGLNVDPGGLNGVTVADATSTGGLPTLFTSDEVFADGSTLTVGSTNFELDGMTVSEAAAEINRLTSTTNVSAFEYGGELALFSTKDGDIDVSGVGGATTLVGTISGTGRNYCEQLAGTNSLVVRQFDTSNANLISGLSTMVKNGNPATIQGMDPIALTADSFTLDAVQVTDSAIEFYGDGTPKTIMGKNDDNGVTIEVDWSNGAKDMAGGASDETVPAIGLFLGNFKVRDGMSQSNGDYQLNYWSQNGAKFGNFAGVSIGSDGIVTALFDNGVTRPVFQIPVATFVNPNGMESMSGNVFISTDNSGEPTLRTAGGAGSGQVSAASLEASTVDIGEEFTTMIVTQRAYSASAKIITTADEMLDELVRIKR